MSVSVGQHVWVPCEVKPGPFSDERLVRVNSPVTDSALSVWTGFVSATRLRDPIEAGSTGVTAIVVDVKQDRFLAQLVGDGLSNTVFEDYVSRAEPIDTVTNGHSETSRERHT
jgi:hypothetical protein